MLRELGDAHLPLVVGTNSRDRSGAAGNPVRHHHQAIVIDFGRPGLRSVTSVAWTVPPEKFGRTGTCDQKLTVSCNSTVSPTSTASAFRTRAFRGTM